MVIFVCDDDQLVLNKTRKYLNIYFRKHNIKDYEIYCFLCGENAVSSNIIPDIAFLDIEMEGISGLKTGELLRRKNEELIMFILTSFAEYLDEAMRVNVFRYLSKPLEKERLFRNLKDAIGLYYSVSKTIEIETRDKSIIMPTKKIICIESDKHVSIIHTVDGDYLSAKPLRYWLDKLNMPCFYQSHRGFVVNLAHVSDYDTQEIRFTGTSCKAYMAARKYTDFKQKMMLYLEGVV